MPARSINWAAIIIYNSVRSEVQKAVTMKSAAISLLTAVMFLKNPTYGETVTCKVMTLWKKLD